METATAPTTTTSYAADMVAMLLRMQPNPDRHEATLRAALGRIQAGIASLNERRLAFVEQGWEASWQTQLDAKKALETELNHVLAERFGY